MKVGVLELEHIIAVALTIALIIAIPALLALAITKLI
jgi:hypothetical protein